MVLSMDRWIGKVAIVTGASAGIGAEICVQLVEAGVKVAGLARRSDNIDKLADQLKGKKGELYAVQADVTKEEDILNAFKWVKENLGPVHILINNAGVVRYTSLIAGETQLWKDVLDTNVLGLCIATREAVKDMRENDVAGHIIHIGSIAGHKVVPVPNFNVYFASKHAVTALTETLRNELNQIGSKIKISAVCPGLVETEIFDAEALGSNQSDISQDRKEFLKVAASLKSSDVADAVTYVLSTPPHVQIHDLIIKPVGEIF